MLSLPIIIMGFSGDQNSTNEVIWLLWMRCSHCTSFWLKKHQLGRSVQWAFLYAPFTAHAIQQQPGFGVRNRERLQWRRKMSQCMEVNRIISLFYKRTRPEALLTSGICLHFTSLSITIRLLKRSNCPLEDFKLKNLQCTSHLGLSEWPFSTLLSL